MPRRRTELAVVLALLLAGAALAVWPERRVSMDERGAEPASSASVTSPTSPKARLPAPQQSEAALTGSVRNARGSGVAFASVCVERQSDSENGPPRYDGRDRRGAVTTLCTRSSGAGDFAFAVLPPGPYRIQAMEPTVGLVSVAARLERARPTHLVLTLQEAAVLTGHVLDIQGGAVPAAKVHAMQQLEAQPGQLATVVAASDESGAFRLLVMPGAVVLRVEADGYADAFTRAHAPATNVTVALAPAARLLGQVLSAVDGEPVAGALVTATRSLPELVLRTGSALSDGEGHFVIDGLTDGTYDVVAEAAGFYGTSAERVELAVAERAAVRVMVRPAVTLSGLVTTSRARSPCADAQLTIRGTRAERPFAAQTTSDAAGRIQFENVPADSYELNVSWRGRTTSLPILVVGDQSRNDLKLELAEGVSVVGRVVDRLGRAVAREKILATPLPERGASIAAESDERGRFELLDLEPGRYGFASASAASAEVEVEVTERGVAKEVVIERGAVGTLAVMLRHEDGTEVASSWQVYVRGERVLPAQRTGASYTFRSLPMGVHRVSVHDGANAPVETTVELGDGERKELTVLLPRHVGVLRGRVIDERGAPVADAWVSAYASTALPLTSTERSVLTSADGTFEFDGIAATGRYTVEAHAGAEGSGSQSDVEPGRAALITLRAEQSATAAASPP